MDCDGLNTEIGEAFLGGSGLDVEVMIRAGGNTHQLHILVIIIITTQNNVEWAEFMSSPAVVYHQMAYHVCFQVQ